VYWTTSTYDGLGRTVSVVEVDSGSTTAYAYAGNTTTITDPAGKWKKQTVDALGNLKTVNEPNPAGGADYVTNYTYDLLNHLTQVSMPRPTGTQTRTFVYNATTQRLTSEAHPENGTTTYTYNSDGTVATKTDAKGQVTKNTYDGYQRVTMIQYYPDPAQPTVEDTCQRMTLTYDTNALDGTFTQNGWGRLTTAQWTEGGCTFGNPDQFTQMYSYTPAGLATKKRLRINRYTLPPGYPSSWVAYALDATYAYDSEGHMTSLTYPSAQIWNGNSLVPQPGTGITFTYGYDLMGRPYSMVDNQGTPVTYVSSVQYNAAGQPTVTNLVNYNETRQYNTRLQLTRLTVGSAMDTDYNYSATQNNSRVISTLRHLASNQTTTYGYDSLNRLTSASATASTLGPAWSETYTYDGFGNLTDKNVTGGSAPSLHVTVDSATNRFTGGGYTYDANGNTKTTGGMTLAYDAANRVSAVGNEGYLYGGDNLRMYKSKNGSEELHVYGAYGERLGVYSIQAIPGGGPPTYYVTMASTALYFAGRLLTAQDRLGSIGTYYPYGEEYTPTGQDGDKYATYFGDAVSNLQYAKNRYYSSAMGRFLTPDPYRASGGPADPGSWNRYAYVGGDPVNFNDPAGLIKERPAIPDDSPYYPPGWVPLIGVAPMSNGGVPAYAQLSNAGGRKPSLLGALSASDRKTLDKAKTTAEDIAENNPHCDDALKDYGIPSLSALLENSILETNIYDGRFSTYKIGGTVSATQYFRDNRTTVGASVVLTGSPSTNVMFLGPAFFDPGIANVRFSYSLAQAFMLLHETVHLVGNKTDQDFGGSKALTRLLVDKCFPILVHRPDSSL
jgi:RHS repeat-associated protein